MDQYPLTECDQYQRSYIIPSSYTVLFIFRSQSILQRRWNMAISILEVGKLRHKKGSNLLQVT